MLQDLHNCCTTVAALNLAFCFSLQPRTVRRHWLQAALAAIILSKNFKISVWRRFALRFRDIAAYWSKIATPLYLAPPLGVKPSYLSNEEKLEWWVYQTVKEFRWCVQPFWHKARVWQTDGRTDGIGVAYTRYSIYAVARKNRFRHLSMSGKCVCVCDSPECHGLWKVGYSMSSTAAAAAEQRSVVASLMTSSLLSFISFWRHCPSACLSRHVVQSQTPPRFH